MRSRVESIVSKMCGTLVYIIKRVSFLSCRIFGAGDCLSRPCLVLRCRLPAQIQSVPALKSIDRLAGVDAYICRLKIDGLVFRPEETGYGVERDGRAAR